MRAELIAQVQTLIKEGGTTLPPVHLWNPPLSGDIDIRIAADGRWYHEGTAFQREALVRLFASILKREGDEYFLVTPVEKWRLRVESTPFIAIDCEVLGSGTEQQLVFVTDVGDRVHCSAGHPLRLLSIAGAEPVPCIMVRDGLEARLARALYYRLVEDGTLSVQGDDFGIWSGGQFFVLDTQKSPAHECEDSPRPSSSR